MGRKIDMLSMHLYMQGTWTLWNNETTQITEVVMMPTCLEWHQCHTFVCGVYSLVTTPTLTTNYCDNYGKVTKVLFIPPATF